MMRMVNTYSDPVEIAVNAAWDEEREAYGVADEVGILGWIYRNDRGDDSTFAPCGVFIKNDSAGGGLDECSSLEEAVRTIVLARYVYATPPFVNDARLYTGAVDPYGMSAIEALRAWLDSRATRGDLDLVAFEALLAEAWGSFETHADEHMAAEELQRGLEDVTWEAPYLRFTIEWHGDAMLASRLADIQHWTLNLDTHSADCATCGSRQLGGRQPRLDVSTLADEMFEAMRMGGEDDRITRSGDGSVRVRIGSIIPLNSCRKQTLIDRRARFRSELERLVVARGGTVVRPNVYRL